MPCYHTGSAEGDANLAAEEARREVTTLTRLLCQACERLEAHDIIMTRDVKSWWDRHKEIDATRRAAERALSEQEVRKAKALAKLSREERELLGLGRQR